jgi:hypothetical protein
LKVIDFGGNTYQYRIDFKLDTLSTEDVKDLAKLLVVDKAVFEAIQEDEDTGDTVFARGAGTKEAPIYQLRTDYESVVLWTGWFVSYEDWQQWRTARLMEVAAQLRNVPTQLVKSLSSQYVFLIPPDRVREGKEVADFEPVRALYRRFVPEPLLSRGNTFVQLSDDEGKETVEVSMSGTPVPGQQLVRYAVQLNAPEVEQSLQANLLRHAARSDELLEHFHEHFLPLVIKG